MRFFSGLLCSFTLAAAVATADEARQQFFDTEVAPRILELGQSGQLQTGQGLAELHALVQQFNAMVRTPTGAPTVISLEMDPYSWRTRLNDLIKEDAVLAFCSSSIQGIAPCDEARTRLIFLSAQCKQATRIVIELDEYPDVPLSLFQDEFPDPGDPNFIMLTREGASPGSFRTVRIFGHVTPNLVAAVLCPEDSNSFGHVLR